MSHKNAALIIEGRRRLIERCRTRPIAHVAAEMGISRATSRRTIAPLLLQLGLNRRRPSTQPARPIADNGACYRSKVFVEAMPPERHQRIAPYTPRHNGKIERCNRILADEFLHARTRTSERERAHRLSVSNVHDNYQPSPRRARRTTTASSTPSRVSNVLASYS